MPSQSAHLFFSYAHDDAARLTPIHAQMQNVLERNLWLDKVGLERGMAWNNAIKAAIDDSYGVIFAVTKTFVTRPFILEREIPWALDRFKDKQGVQLFPILFDDVELPELLKTPYITYPIKAFEISFEAVLEELKKKLPAPEAGVLPFMVDWPRLANFKGRDNQLIELHQQLMGDGRVGMKMAGLHGMGGIGKTQLAVEYAHRYRYHYPGGVYWLNAGADWHKEMVACADRLGLTPIDPSDNDRDKQMTLAFQKYLAAQGKDALLVLDNVDDPAEVTRREIAPKLTMADLATQTRTRLLLTTRIQKLPEGFADVSVNILSPLDARAVLMDAWISGGRKDTPDTQNLDAIAQALGYLPLGLILSTSTLTKKPTLTPASLLDHLRKSGIDQIADKVGLERENTKTKYVSRVDVALEWQIRQLEKANSQTLLALLSAFGEAAIVPRERLRLLAGLTDDDLDTPFSDAISELTDYHLIEPLSEGTTFRLHPLIQVYTARTLDAVQKLTESVPHLVAAYRDPATLDTQTRIRGFDAVIEDLRAMQALLTAKDTKLDELTRLLTLEEPHLLVLPDETQAGYIIQQIHERAHHESDDQLKKACDMCLKGKRHLYHNGLRYPTNKSFIRTMSGHTSWVRGALELRDGRILSWSNDWTSRLWEADGREGDVLRRHTASVNGMLELRDGRILSWSNDGTIRLWEADGREGDVLSGHRGFVNGVLELRDGRILSWSNDRTLRLWEADGRERGVLSGHTASVNGVLELRDGRILSWSNDGTIRLWEADGREGDVLSGYTARVNGVLELRDGRILSWLNDRTLRLWEADGREGDVLSGHTASVTGVLELRDGRILSWSNDRTLRLWEADGREGDVLSGHTASVTGVLELRDGRILSWADDETLRLWNSDGREQDVLSGHTASVKGALELGDGRILSWADDKMLRLWNGDGREQGVLSGHTASVKGGLELRDGRILSWADDETLRLWNGDGREQGVLSGHTGLVRNGVELRDGRILSWADDKMLRLWNSDGREQGVLSGHTASVNGGLELRDGRILSWADDKMLRLWNGDGREQGVLSGHTASVNGGLELRDGRILSWADDKMLRLWNSDGREQGVLSGHTVGVNGGLELRDGRILSWGYENTLWLWDGDGRASHVLSGHTDSVIGALELRDGRILSWAGDKTLRLWNSDGYEQSVLSGHTDNVIRALELRDGRILSWAGGYGSNDNTLRLWNSDGHDGNVLSGHRSWVNGGVELRDGRILSWADDGTLRLWNKDGYRGIVLIGHRKAVYGALELSDDRILSWADDGRLRLWSAHGKPLATYASDTAITCCIVMKNGRIVVGDRQGRVLFLTVEEGE